MLLGRTHGEQPVRLCLKSVLGLFVKTRLLIILGLVRSLRVCVLFCFVLFCFVLFFLEAERADQLFEKTLEI